MSPQHCDCFRCVNPKALLIDVATHELYHVIENKRDDVHAYARVLSYIELFYRTGDFREEMPYEVWRAVMGNVPPPWNHAGAFRRIYWEHCHFLPTPRPN